MKLTYEGWDLVLHVVTPERLMLLRTVRQHHRAVQFSSGDRVG
jgi:hypothetical protein